jgi:hypothetical protein
MCILEVFGSFEVNWNIPVTNIQKWKNVNAIRSVMVAWRSISSTVICNCFTEEGFGIEKSANEEEEGQDNNDWKQKYRHVVCASEFHNFTDYINVGES